MKIIIPSRGRPDTITTHLLFEELGVDYKIVLHNNEEKSYYLMNPTIPPERIVVSDQPFCIGTVRNWIQDNLIEDGEWFIGMDDNIRGFTGVADPELYDEHELPVKSPHFNSAEAYNRHISPLRFLEICEEMKIIGEAQGAYNCGFAITDNPYYRSRKYRWVGYVIGKMFIRKNTDIRFDGKNCCLEDLGFTAEHLLRYGKVLINNYIYRIAKHYQEGGIGTVEQRLECKIKRTEELMKQYPELFRMVHKKVKGGTMPDLRFRKTKVNQIAAWRKWMNHA